MRRILVCRSDRIGDLVLTLPVFDALRARWPDAEITALVRSYTAPIVAGHPSVDGHLLHDPEGNHAGWAGTRRLAAELAEGGFDAAIVAYGGWSIAAALWMAGIPRRVGNGYRSYGLLFFNERVFLHRTKVPIHEKDYCLRFAEALGASATGEPPRIPVTEEELEGAREALREVGVDLESSFAAVHPGDAGSALNASEERYGDYARVLVENGLQVVLTGAAGEAERVERIRKAVGEGVFSLAGKVDLRGLAAALSLARLMVAGSTGPLHVAAAVGTPPIALFPPLRAQSPAKWGPLHPRAQILVPPVETCPRCRPVDCDHAPCMDEIDKSAFRKALLVLLGGVSSADVGMNGS